MNNSIFGKTLFFLALFSAFFSPVNAEEGAIEQIKGGYELTVPPTIKSNVRAGEAVSLTVQSKSGRSQIEAVVEKVEGDKIRLRSSEKLDIFPSRASIGLGTSGSTCGIQHFLGACNFAFCAGTVYCLPGNGPGGFTCDCI